MTTEKHIDDVVAYWDSPEGKARIATEARLVSEAIDRLEPDAILDFALELRDAATSRSYSLPFEGSHFMQAFVLIMFMLRHVPGPRSAATPGPSWSVQPRPLDSDDTPFNSNLIADFALKLKMRATTKSYIIPGDDIILMKTHKLILAMLPYVP